MAVESISSMGGSDFRELPQIGVQNVTPQDETGEFAVAHAFDEAGVFEFLSVVGHCGGADRMDLEQLAAWCRAGAAADLFQDFDAAGFGEGTGDQRKLPVVETLFGASYRARGG